MTKKEKTGFFLLCGKQAKINALIFLIFYCTSSFLSATGWGLPAVSANLLFAGWLFYFGQKVNGKLWRFICRRFRQ
ncbi:hypothetical protein J0B02_04020 [Enterobacteriaceae bacterium YMB-R22]|uniref:hypothetical protein n=1 Tax=Tenebrionicola larvae TaxID=2815733 RepID=UPI00201298DC|nr:hypothetical protein [Tenebrionicola larvae]MBV4412005.1 hypothetical protein [Tenebrionicola larvae]